MQIRTPFFIVLFLACLNSSAQYSEWKEFGLKGPVQSVTSCFYSENYFSETPLAIPDSLAWTHKTVRFFNTLGMVEWYFSTHSFTDKDSIKTFNTTYVSYAFDSTQTKVGGAAHSKKVREEKVIGTSSENYSYQWLNPLRYIETVYDSSNTKLISTFEYVLDSDFFIISEHHKYYWGSTAVPQLYQIGYTKNSNGQIESCEEWINDGEIKSTKIYDYRTMDQYGNPTSFVVEVKTEINTYRFLVIKSYTYFSESE